MKCAILNCEKQFFSHCGIPLDDIVGCLNKNGESILKNPVPFCNHHYHLVYNAYQPAQSHCPTCGSVLKRGNTRPCPNPHNIECYLSEIMGFEGRITEGDMVCFVCYKSHLQILKEAKSLSTDRELQDQIKLTKSNVLQVHDIEDTTWCVSDQSSPQPLPLYRSNAEETDTRLWLHVHHSSATNIYVVSPDTDVYHVGLPLDLGDKHILINTAGSSQKRILSLSNLKTI